MMAEHRRTSTGPPPLSNGYPSPRRQRSSVSATPGSGERVVPPRKGSMPIVSELRSMGAGHARGSTASLPGMMGMMGHGHGGMMGMGNAAGSGSSGVPLNFAGIFAQQFSLKKLDKLDDELVAEREEGRIVKLRKQTEKRNNSAGILQAVKQSAAAAAASSSALAGVSTSGANIAIHADTSSLAPSPSVSTMAAPSLKPPTRQRRASFSLFSGTRDSEAGEDLFSGPLDVVQESEASLFDWKRANDDENQTLRRSSTQTGVRISSHHCEAVDSTTRRVHTFGTLPRARSRGKLIQLLSSHKERVDKLKERLATFESQGLPPASTLPEELDLQLEASWEEVVKDPQKLCKESRMQQAAIWELLQTEVNLVGLLRVLVEVYFPCLEEVRRLDGLLLDVDTEKLMHNICDVFMAACKLWTAYLQPCLRRARDSGDPLNPSDFREGFIHFQDVLRPYAKFTIFRAECKTYHESLSKDEVFTEFVRWTQNYSSQHCEWIQKSADLNLESLLSQPWQRLQRYPLILKEIRRYTMDEEELNDVNMMIEVVEGFCADVDCAVKSKEHEDELKSIRSRLEEIRVSDMLESPSEECQRILNEFGCLDLLKPMTHCRRLRIKLHQGQLKMRDEKGKWTEVVCFLFSDMLLITRSSKRGAGDRLKQIRSPVRLDKLQLRRLCEGGLGSLGAGATAFVAVILNDFQDVSGAHVFSGDAKSVDEWFARVRNAQEQFSEDLNLRTDLSAGDNLYLSCKPDSPPLGGSAPSAVTTPTPYQYSPGPPTAQMHRTQSEGPGWMQSQQKACATSASSTRVHDNRVRSRTLGSTNSDSALITDYQEQASRRSPQPSPLTTVSRKLSSPGMQRRDGNREAPKISATPPSISVNDSVSNANPLDPETEEDALDLQPRRVCRTDKRYMTDSVREMSSSAAVRDPSIHKRLSWNCGPNPSAAVRRGPCSSPPALDSQAQSMESFRSSSGFSSSGSHRHSGSELSEADSSGFGAAEPESSSSSTINGEPTGCSSSRDVTAADAITLKESDQSQLNRDQFKLLLLMHDGDEATV